MGLIEPQGPVQLVYELLPLVASQPPHTVDGSVHPDVTVVREGELSAGEAQAQAAGLRGVREPCKRMDTAVDPAVRENPLYSLPGVGIQRGLPGFRNGDGQLDMGLG